MKFTFLSRFSFENWDYRNPFTKGIGGSEVSHIEMSSGLAEKGHDVVSYAPIPEDLPNKPYRQVEWKSCEKDIDWNRDGIWIIYRALKPLEQLKNTESQKANQQIWVVMQDTEIIDAWKPERLEKIDRLITLSKEHYNDICKRYPKIKDKVVISSNGIRSDLIREIEKKNIVRNPKRIIYASCPYRGFINVLEIFTRAQEWIEDLELHIYYGFENIDKYPQTREVRAMKDALAKHSKNPAITFHGRVNQMDLYEEWFKSGIWLYPTNFTETSCITSMDAQACGAIPITAPIWALHDNVKFGAFIQGNIDIDPLVKARYVVMLQKFMNLNLQNDIRPKMMEWARNYFDWNVFINQWEGWALEDEKSLKDINELRKLKDAIK